MGTVLVLAQVPIAHIVDHDNQKIWAIGITFRLGCLVRFGFQHLGTTYHKG